jgi:hypothetical protein
VSQFNSGRLNACVCAGTASLNVVKRSPRESEARTYNSSRKFAEDPKRSVVKVEIQSGAAVE